MSSCLPEYVQSQFLARANEFRPMEDPVIVTAHSSLKMPDGEGEPAVEGEHNGEPHISPLHTDQHDVDVGTSKEKPVTIDDSPELEKDFTYATALEGHNFQINHR